jgi:hypothetical protein
VIAQWLQGQPSKNTANDEPPLSINTLILAYWDFAEKYYGFDGSRGDAYCIRDALRVV